VVPPSGACPAVIPVVQQTGKFSVHGQQGVREELEEKLILTAVLLPVPSKARESTRGLSGYSFSRQRGQPYTVCCLFQESYNWRGNHSAATLTWWSSRDTSLM